MAADTSTTFNGQGFTQWAVETGGQANRDLVLQGMQLQIPRNSIHVATSRLRRKPSMSRYSAN
jgi:hypothetical protein